MILRALFREYDHPNNTVTGLTGSNALIGTGTKFSLLKSGCMLEIDDYGFAGKVESIQSDTSLTLDRPLDADIADKNYWIDWSNYLIEISGRSRKIETDNEGEAGAITLDNVSLQFYFGEGLDFDGVFIQNPIPANFENFTSVKRFLIKLKVATWDFKPEGMFVVTKDYKQLVDQADVNLTANFKCSQTKQIYEGMIDFSSVKYPAYPDGEGEFFNTIRFSLLDKLSSASLVRTELTRQKDTVSPALTGPSIDRISFLKHWDNSSFSFNYKKVTGSNIYSPQITNEENTPELGDIIQLNMLHGQDENAEEYALLTFKYLRIVDPNDLTYNRVYYDCITTKSDYFQDTTSTNKLGSPSSSIRDANITWFNKLFYNEDIYIKQWNPNKLLRGPSGPYDTGWITVSGYEIVAIDGLKILKAIIKQVWADVIILNLLTDLNGSPITEFRLPLNYIFQLLDEYPFGQETLDALSFLANSMNCFMYFNQNGHLVLQSRKSLDDTDPTFDKTIPVGLISKMEKEEFWDKLNDAVEIKVTSWLKEDEDSQEYLTGEGYAYKRDGIKPRNQLSKEVFLDVDSLSSYGISIQPDGKLSDPAIPDGDQSAILNRYGDLKAGEYLDFYGKRHVAYNITFCKIIFEMTNWEMLDTFRFVRQKCFTGDKNNGRYFIQKLDFNDTENTVDIKLVSISRIAYDENSVLIGMGEKSQNIAASKAYLGVTGIPGKTVYDDYPLKKEGVVYCDATSNEIQIALPDVVKYKNAEYLLQKVDKTTNKVIVNGAIGDIINPELEYTGHEIRFKSDGIKWNLLNDFYTIRTKHKLVVEDYTVKPTDKIIWCNTADGDITLTLPDVELSKDIEFFIRKIDESLHRVIFNDSIDDFTNSDLYYLNDEIRIRSNGGKWETINNLNKLRYSKKDVSSDHTLTLKEKVILVDASSSPITISLPSAAIAKNFEFFLQKKDSSENKVIISGVVNGVINPELYYPNQDCIIRSDGSGWSFVNGFSRFTKYDDVPVGNLTPYYIHEMVYDSKHKTWYQAFGTGINDWMRTSASVKKYTANKNPNGNVLPDYPGQTCEVTIDGKTELWYSKSFLNSSWFKYVGYEANDIVLEALTDGKVKIRKPGGVAGTDEIQISFDSENAIIESKKGGLKLSNLMDASGNKHVAIDKNDYAARQAGDMHFIDASGVYRRLAAVPGNYLKCLGDTLVWAEGTGDVGQVFWEDIPDRPIYLSNFNNDLEFVTPEVMNSQGFLKQGNTPETILVSQQYVDSNFIAADQLSSLASQAWVNSQNYLQQGATPDAQYPTLAWISEQSFLKNADFSAYALQSAIDTRFSNIEQWANTSFVAYDSLDVYATQTWVNSQSFIRQGATAATRYVTEEYVNNTFVKPEALNSLASIDWINSEGFLKQGTTPDTTYVTAQYVNNNFVTPDLLSGYPTAEWINSQNYLKQGDTPETTFVTAQYVNNAFVTPDLLIGVAYQSWVNQQGFLKQGTTPQDTYVTAWYVNYHFVTPDLLDGYATTGWVNSQNFLTQGTTPETTYVTAQYVNNNFVTPDLLTGVAYQGWVNTQGFLKQGSTPETTFVTAQYVNTTFVTPDLLTGVAYQGWVNTQGFLKQGSTPETTYVTAQYVNNNFVTPDLLTGVAYQGWVNTQGFLKQGSTPDTQYPTVQYVNATFLTPDLLNGYATTGWVNSQNFLTQGSTPETTYVTAQYVNNNFVTPDLLTGVAYQGWVNTQGFLKQGSTPETQYPTVQYVNATFLTPDLLNGYATTGWVNSQNFMTQGSTPETTYVTAEYVNSNFVTPDLLTGVAYQGWVNTQGFLKQGSTPETQYPTVQYVNTTFLTPDLLNGYATTGWVNSQNFMTQGSTPETTYVTAQYVNSNFVTPDLLTGVAYQGWVNTQGFLRQGSTPETQYPTVQYVNTTFLTPDLLNGYATTGWVNSQNFMTQGSTPETTYVTAQYVNNNFVTPDLLTGVAYQGWVNTQGFLKQGSTPETQYPTVQYVNTTFLTPDLLNGYATTGWVNSQNFMTQGSTPETTYVTAQYVNSNFVTPDLLTGVAYQGWVNTQGFLKQGSTPETQYPTVQYVNATFLTPDLLNGYATTGWVNSQNFMTQGSTPETTYVTADYVNNTFVTPDLLVGIAYQNWVNTQGFLKQGSTPETQYPTVQYVNATFLTPDLLSGYATESRVMTILADYPTNTDLSNSLSAYVSNNTLNDRIDEVTAWVNSNFLTPDLLNGYATTGWVTANFSDKSHNHSAFNGSFSLIDNQGNQITVTFQNGIGSFEVVQI